MAKQYQQQNQQEYSDLDFEEIEEETQPQKYHFKSSVENSTLRSYHSIKNR